MTAGCDIMSALTLDSPAKLATNCVLIGHLANRAYGSRQMFPHGTHRRPLSVATGVCRDQPSEKNAHGREP
jgi:hypothetical protein